MAEASMDGAFLVDAAAIGAFALPQWIARKATSLPVGRLSPRRARGHGVQVIIGSSAAATGFPEWVGALPDWLGNPVRRRGYSRFKAPSAHRVTS
jgi:hypothetical protein